MTQRLYLSTVSPVISPAVDAIWAASASGVNPFARGQLNTDAADLGMQSVTPGTGGADDDVVHLQGVYGPLAAQTISGTVKGQVGGREANAATDARMQMIIRVVSSDGSVVRGTLLALDSAALANEFNASVSDSTGILNRQAPRGGSTALSSVVALDQDYLVVEWGHRNHGTNTGNVRIRQHETGASTDAPEDETTNVGNSTGYRGWVEFSSNLSPYVAAVEGFPVVEARVAWRPEQFNKVTNPGFETNTTGWSVSAGINGAGTSITRITSDFHSGVGSGSLVCPATIDTGVNFDFGTQTFFQSSVYGIAYRFVVWLKSTSGTTQASIIVGSEGTSSDRRSRDISLTTEWQPFYIDWLPTGTRTDVQLAITNTVAVAMTAKIDDVAVYIRDAHTQVENGYFTTNTTGWSVGAGINGAGTSITRQASGGFYGVATGRLVTTGTSGSGMNFDLGTSKYTSGRTYRARVYLRSISDSTSARLRLGSLGTGADRGDASVTITTEWAAYTVNWTPSGDRTDAELAVTNGSAAIVTADVDGVEVYEALDDISADAFGENGGSALDYGRGASFDGSAQAIGYANLRVVNDDGKYTPENASGVLYGLLTSGKRVLIRATYDGDPYPIFHGVIRRLVPMPMSYACEIRCEDMLTELARIRMHKEHLPISYHDARVLALTEGMIQNYAAENGPVESLVTYRGTDSTSILDYLAVMDRATGSVHFVRPSVYASLGWEIVFRDRTVHSDASTPSETWDDDLSDLSGYDVTDEAIVNRQSVAVTAYEVGILRTIVDARDPATIPLFDDPDGKLYIIDEQINASFPADEVPFTVPANTKRVLHFSFASVQQPVVAVYYNSGSCTVIQDDGATYLTLTLIAGSTDAVVQRIQVDGYPLIRLSLNDEEQADEESVWLDGDRSGNDIDSPYVSHPAHASGLAAWHIWRRDRARARPSALRHNLYVSQLSREVSDRVTLEFARLSITGKAFSILSFATTISQGSHDWQTSYQLEELPAAPDDGWFLLGTSALGGDAVLAY